MVRVLDIDGWKRREHFEFYRDFQNPFFSVCANVDVTGLKDWTKQTGASFFLASLFLSIRAANAIEEFRLRIRDGQVVVHDVISAGSTVLRADETFGFCTFDYVPDFARFQSAGRQTLERFHAAEAKLEPHAERDDLVYYSVLPWIAFTSFSHARQIPTRESVPRIVFGKAQPSNGRSVMPVSVEVHHALVDGLHVGRFLEAFQAGVTDCASALGSVA